MHIHYSGLEVVLYMKLSSKLWSPGSFSPAWVVCEEESVMSVWGSIIFYKETRTNHMLGRDTVGTEEKEGETADCSKFPQEWKSHHADSLVSRSSFRCYKGHFSSYRDLRWSMAVERMWNVWSTLLVRFTALLLAALWINVQLFIWINKMV